MIDCFDIVSMAIADASESVFVGVKQNKEALRSVKALCVDVNSICEKLNAFAAGVDVDKASGEITLTMYCPFISLSGVTTPIKFALAASHVPYIRISASNEDEVYGNIAVSFIHPGVWEIAV